jgi:hypothetical protein
MAAVPGITWLEAEKLYFCWETFLTSLLRLYILLSERILLGLVSVTLKPEESSVEVKSILQEQLENA